MMSVFEEQANFMLACGQTVGRHNEAQRILYRELIAEEMSEFIAAQTEEDKADAVIDLLVVLIGYGHSRGWPMDRLWDEVMRSNMSKVDTTTGKVVRRKDGKILKPTAWSPPDIKGVLKQGVRA